MTRWVRTIERYLAVSVAATEISSALGMTSDLHRAVTLGALAVMLIISLYWAAPRGGRALRIGGGRRDGC